MNPPPQAAFLYYGPWTAEADLILLDTIIKLKKETHWTENQFPSWFMMTAEQELRSKAGVLVSEEDISKRLDVLLRRYKIFKDVALKFGAKWHRPTNYIIASDDVWARIMKYNWFAGAYFYKGEPEYDRLECLFGMADVKVEEEKHVVVLYDNTEKLPTNDLEVYEIEVVDDEVNSPVVFPPPTVRRKLFDIDDLPPPPTERESTNDMGVCFIDLDPDGQLRPRYEKGRILPPSHKFNPPRSHAKHDVAGPSTRSAYGSSVGSNSPIGWLPYAPN